MSTVSVIVPCYNYAHFLRECVESVLSQTGVAVSVLIIDDASSDNTPEVAGELVAHDSRVEYRRHVKNCRHIATYNEGLAWASGDYTVLLSADDLLTSGSLSRAAQLMDAHPEVGFVYGRCVKFIDGQPLPQTRFPSEMPKWGILNGLDFLEFVCKTGQSWITSPEVMVRTHLQHELGGYLQELPHTGDQEMWMRFAVHAAVGQILDADQAFYRMHSQSMHTSQFSVALKDIQERRAAFDFVFKNYRDLIPGWERLWKMAKRSLASEALWVVCQALYRRQAAQTPVLDLIKYATDSDQGKFFELEFLPVYFGLSARILHSVRVKLGSVFG